MDSLEVDRCYSAHDGGDIERGDETPDDVTPETTNEKAATPPRTGCDLGSSDETKSEGQVEDLGSNTTEAHADESSAYDTSDESGPSVPYSSYSQSDESVPSVQSEVSSPYSLSGDSGPDCLRRRSDDSAPSGRSSPYGLCSPSSDSGASARSSPYSPSSDSAPSGPSSPYGLGSPSGKSSSSTESARSGLLGPRTPPGEPVPLGRSSPYGAYSPSGGSAPPCPIIPLSPTIPHVPSGTSDASNALPAAQVDDNLIACNYCDNKLVHPDAMQQHLRLHNHLNPYFCTKCGKRFQIREGLLGHASNCKGHRLNKQASKKKRGSGGICEFCDTECSTKEALAQHILVHLAAKPYLCLHCGKKLKTRNDLIEHRNQSQNWACRGTNSYRTM